MSGSRKTRVRVEIEALELAKGHDGFLHGAPEPVIILGAFVVDQGAARLLGRSVTRFHHPGKFPCRVTPRLGQTKLDERVALGGSARIAVVCLAVEQDSREGVQALYAALERAPELAVFQDGSEDPTPLYLDELADADWQTPCGVHLLCDGRDAADLCEGDDWVGGAVVSRPAGGRSIVYRVHFVSPDGRNDWTAQMRFRP